MSGVFCLRRLSLSRSECKSAGRIAPVHRGFVQTSRLWLSRTAAIHIQKPCQKQSAALGDCTPELVTLTDVMMTMILPVSQAERAFTVVWREFAEASSGDEDAGDGGLETAEQVLRQLHAGGHTALTGRRISVYPKPRSPPGDFTISRTMISTWNSSTCTLCSRIACAAC